MADYKKVDLNLAGRDELMSVTGINSDAADSILRYRQEHGGFHSVDELKSVGSIETNRFDQLRDCFTVGQTKA